MGKLVSLECGFNDQRRNRVAITVSTGGIVDRKRKELGRDEEKKKRNERLKTNR